MANVQHLSRRGVLCAACAAVGARAWPAFAATTPPATFAVEKGAEVAQAFAYGDVQLTGGPLKAQYDQVHAHYLALDNDRLLKVYRQHAGLPAPGAEMGGWYDRDGFVPGHTLGQYISGLARIGATTGDAACRQKVDELVAGFGEALDQNSSPFAGAKAETIWPAYILDKHEIGLIDAYRLTGNTQAKALLPRVIAGGLPFVSPVSRDRIGKKDPPYDETFVLPENLFAVAEITGDRRYHDLAVRYLLDPELFDPLARGEDVLPGKHAYSHAIALSSGAQAYLVTGDPKYRQALVNAWKFLELQRYASGGWGPEEQFIQPHTGALYDSLTSTKAHFETPCGSYASMKLQNYLMRFTGDGRYGDGLERIIYNALLGARTPDSNGDYPYYSTYGPNADKAYYPMKWPCCSGTLVQGVADYVQNIYFRAPDGVYVTLFAPSIVSWSPAGGAPVSLVQETAYPAQDSTRLTVRTAVPQTFTVRLRLPGWLSRPASLNVNGTTIAIQAKDGFAVLTRTWRDGDRIELVLPQSFHVEPIDDRNLNTVAVMRGGMMYVGVDPWPGVERSPLNLPGGLTPVTGQAQAFVKHIHGKELVFIPFHAVQAESYSTYFLKA